MDRLNRLMCIALVGMFTGVLLASDALAGVSLPYAPAGPPVPVYEFCYAFGLAGDHSATTYFTGAFLATPIEMADVQNQFRQFIAGKYGSQPDPPAAYRTRAASSPAQRNAYGSCTTKVH